MKLFIYAINLEEVLKDNLRWSLTISDSDNLSGGDYVLLGEFDVDLNLDREALTGVAIDNIEESIKDVKAKTETAIITLEQRKQNLLALTHQT